MDPHHLVFLKLLDLELSRDVLPAAGTDAARQVTGIATQQLKRILVEETVARQFHADAMAAYRELLPLLRAEVDATQYAALESVLAAEIPDRKSIDAALASVTTTLLARADQPSRQLAGRVIAIDAQARARKEQACAERSKAAPAAAEAGGLGEVSADQVARLLAFLKQRFPGESNLQITAVRPLNGGFSKQTLFVDLADNVDLPSRLVMRRDPPYETQGTSVTMEFPILQKVYGAGVSVPRPYAVDAGGDVLGTPFILLSMVAGRTVGDFLVVHEPSRKLALNLAQRVAALHRVSIDGLEDMLPGGRVAVRERLRGEIEKHQAMWRKVVHHQSYAVQAALDWLLRNIHLADGPRTLVHRDIGVHNLLVVDDDVTAFLDWETVVVGTPAEDVAYTYYHAAQMIDWDDYLAAYEQEAGVNLDRRQLDFYMLWPSVRIMIGLASMVDPVYSGDRASLLQFYLGDYFAQSLMSRITSKLAEILR